MAKRTTEEPDHLQDALDAIDTLHASVLALADAEHADEDTLTGDDDLPAVTFEAGAFKKRPERGGLTVDARVTLSATTDQAEAIVFALLRQIREGADPVALEVDGRLVVSREATADVASALKSIDR